MTNNKYTIWTDAEKEIIKKYYTTLKTKKLVDMLPGRTYKAISFKAGEMGLKKDNECDGFKQFEFLKENPERKETWRQFLHLVKRLDKMSDNKAAVVASAMEFVRGSVYEG